MQLSGNQLTGEIPPQLGQLTNLTSLWLSGNQLTGEIPNALGQLTNLTSLQLNENQLTGEIPNALGQLANLTSLQLNENQLTGKPPRGLRRRRLTLLALDPLISGLSPEQQRLVAQSAARPDGGNGDEIAAIIAAGESKTVEFKATLRVNLETGKRDKRMEHAVLKNIAAFLNTDGGALIIGVNDKGHPLGLDNDGFASEDKMGQHLSNLVSGHIGASAFGNIDPEFVTYQGKRILVIRCTRSDALIFVGKDKEFYVRAGAEARQLNPLEFKDFLEGRFP